MGEFSPLESAQRRSNALINQRKNDGWDPEYRELAEYLQPWKSRFMTTDKNKGRKRGNKIINGIGRLSLRVLQAGMVSGMSNPARPWFNLESFDPELMEFQPVKEWLERVEMTMNLILTRSNFYQALPNMYSELGGFGTGCISIMEDYDDVINTAAYTAGEYAIAVDKLGRTSAFTREYEDTVENVIREHGYDRVQPSTREKYDRGDYDKLIKCFHLIERNQDDNIPLPGAAKNRKFRNLYWEQGAVDKTANGIKSFLSANGMFEMPVMSPRWDTNSGDIYGNGPGQDALADVKQVQTMERRKLNKLEKSNNPPMQGPASLKNERTSSLPGDMTYVPTNSANQKYEPAYQVDGDIRWLSAEIQTKERSVEQYFYADVFRAAMNDNRDQRATAREIAEVHEEKLIQLGPVLNRCNYEGFDPMIERIYRVATRAASRGSLLPPPPPEMRGHPVTVKYVSILAQAQRLVDSASIERQATFTTTLAAAGFPEALDRFDVDAAIDKYQEVNGAPITIVRPLAKAEELRKGRAQAQAAQQQQEQAAQAIQGAQQLSQTDTAGSNALTDLFGA